MKGISILIFAGFISLAHAQTPLISHKSHSGAAATYFIDPSSNFGEPGPQLIQLVRLSDSTLVHVYSDFFSGFIYHDTVRDRISYDLNIDSIKQTQNNRVEYVNFKHSPKSAKVKNPGDQQIQVDEAPIEPQPAAPVKKKKTSYLIFLFGITGGGMLLMRLFRSSKSIQPIA